MGNNTILIGKYIYQFLMENAELQKMVNGNVYPLISTDDVDFPFIVYGRESVTPKYCKDLNVEDDVNLRFYIVSDNYSEAITVANKVRQILENRRFVNEEICIDRMHVTSVSESFDENSYIEEIFISATCRNIN